MPGRLTCPQGHEWEPVDDAPCRTPGAPATCPVCGAPARPPDKDATRTEATQLWEGPVAPPPPEETGTGRRTGGLLEPPGGGPLTWGPREPTPAVPAELPVLAGYEILGELGRGGMGMVYKARQKGLGRLVALKMILSGAHAGPEELARFRREAGAGARLQHPNIVPGYEGGESGGRPFFSMELVEGGSLLQKVASRPQPAREAAQLVETLARAIHYAHQRGVVHRDLKPANILLAGGRRQPPDDPTGSGGPGPPLADCVPKISDFGLANTL